MRKVSKRRILQALPQPQLDCLIYSNGPGWTVLQVFAHLVLSREGFFLLIEDVLSGGPGAPEDFDIDWFNEKDVNDLVGLSLDELVSDFSEFACPKCSTDCQLNSYRSGSNWTTSFSGVTSLEEIIKLLYRHNQIHQRDVRRFLNAHLDGMVE